MDKNKFRYKHGWINTGFKILAEYKMYKFQLQENRCMS